MPHKSLLVAGRYEQHPTVIAKLFRKRLAVASETNAAEALNEEQVKNLTGGDRLEGRRMREDPWEFWPTHTLVMFSNHKPAIRGRDEGMWRRVRLVPWEVTIAAKDRDELLSTKLQAEAAGDPALDRRRRRRGSIVRGSTRPPRCSPPQRVPAVGGRHRPVLRRGARLRPDACTATRSTSRGNSSEWCEDQGIVPPRMNDVAAILRQRGAKDVGRRKNWAGRCDILGRSLCVMRWTTEDICDEVLCLLFSARLVLLV